LKVFSKYLILLQFFFALCTLSAQETLLSSTFVKTQYQNKDFFANQNASLLIYNHASNDFFMIVDFAKLKLGIDSLDEWLGDLVDTKLIFKGELDANQLPNLSNHGFKAIKVNGKIKFNDVVNPFPVEIVLYCIAPDGVLYRKTGNEYFDKTRVNIQLVIKPKEFKIDKKQHHLKKTISINIGNGIVNSYVPGMENLINVNFN
jgi:hypothetical protein